MATLTQAINEDLLDAACALLAFARHEWDARRKEYFCPVCGKQVLADHCATPYCAVYRARLAVQLAIAEGGES